MPKTRQFVRHKVVILHQQGDSPRGISYKLGISWHGEQCPWKTWQNVEDKRRGVRPQKLPAADKQYLKVTSYRNPAKTRPEQCIRPQFIHLLFTEALTEMVLVKVWLLKSQSVWKGKETGKKKQMYAKSIICTSRGIILWQGTNTRLVYIWLTSCKSNFFCMVQVALASLELKLMILINDMLNTSMLHYLREAWLNIKSKASDNAGIWSLLQLLW